MIAEEAPAREARDQGRAGTGMDAAVPEDARNRAVEYRRDRFVISTDRARLDIAAIHDYLANRSYWAQGRPREVVQRSIEHSLCFGVYDGEQLVGFARVVTDYATFAWLCDVFILESHRGAGLGKWLVECIVAHPDMQGLKLFVLATSNAHELYRRYGGFESLTRPEKWMARPAQGLATGQRPA